MRAKLFSSIFIMLTTVLILLTSHCSPAPLCNGDKSSTTFDPKGSTCQRSCECNNQLYEGYCLNGICEAIKRETCQTEKKKRPCTPFILKGNECHKGEQICQKNEQGKLLWGDCKPIPKVKENTLKRCTNGEDDDCDGKIDEFDEECQKFCKPGDIARFCYTGKANTLDRGICRRGTQYCGKDHLWSKCEGEIKATKEICNGKDDDCDGLVDEEVKGCKAKPCKEGEIVPCYRSEKGCTLNPDGSFKCRGICRVGTKVCLKGHVWSSCKGEILPKSKEICNKVDDNCNGFIDENCPCYSDNDCPSKLRCINQQCVPATTCQNGEKRPCYTGPKSTQGVGECQAGTQYCQDGFWSQCLGDTRPSKERCDGLDNDCDGKIDNGLIPPFCKKQQGVCQGAKRVCGGKKGWLPCTKQNYIDNDGRYVEDEKDLCDGVDNDCDGTVDEGCSCSTGEQRPCYSGPKGTEGFGKCKAGIQKCLKGVWGQCEGQVTPATEICDGKDNNCDGYIDETFPDDGADCPLPKSQQKGECRRGVWKCEKGKRICHPTNNQKPEICDGKDNNCDGIIDNATLESGKPCKVPNKKGICAQGETYCHVGKLSCRPLFAPKKEECNGKDDDCDGLIDNINGTKDPLFKRCYTGPTKTRNKGECSDGKLFCRQGSWESHCKGDILPKKEECNGKDDDCDGYIDNEKDAKGKNRPLQEECYTAKDPKTAGIGPCKKGFRICQSGIWSRCQNEVTPTTEICDGKDNNCNGQIDESYPEQNKTCLIPKKLGICAQGRQVCTQGHLSCISNAIPTPEICDGLDNDCNGVIDDLPPIHCGVGECAVTVPQCLNGQKNTCKPKPKGGELRNGRDNNCDGYIDKVTVTTYKSYYAPESPRDVIVDDSRKTLMLIMEVKNKRPNGDHRQFAIEIQQHSLISGASHAIYSIQADNPYFNMGFDPLHYIIYLALHDFYPRRYSRYYDAQAYPLIIINQRGNIIETIGNRYYVDYRDYNGHYSRFHSPYAAIYDPHKKFIYIADAGNHIIRYVDKNKPSSDYHYVSTFAGRPQKSGFLDGKGNNARFDSPRAIALDPQGILYIADYNNHCIRRIDPTTREVTTIAGSTKAGFKNGIGDQAEFNHPFSLRFDRQGNLYVADLGNNAIRKIKIFSYNGRWYGNVTTLAGSGFSGMKNGTGKVALFNEPLGVGPDSKGNIYVADHKNRALRKISQ